MSNSSKKPLDLKSNRWAMDVFTHLLEVSTAIRCRTREEETREDRLWERLRATKCGRHYISMLLM